MVQIQRNFLWGGSDEVRKMAWVRWSRICLPKDQCGLGVRNMEIFNVSLLGKWKWWLLVDKNSVWSEFMKYLYGETGVLKQRQHSVWWKDINRLDFSLRHAEGWFQQSVSCKLGNGKELLFWLDCWCSQWSLMKTFPQLFSVTEKPEGAVCEVSVEQRFNSVRAASIKLFAWHFKTVIPWCKLWW